MNEENEENEARRVDFLSEKFVFGIIGLILIVAAVILSMTNLIQGEEKDFKKYAIKILFSLGAASYASLITGFIKVKYKNILQAGAGFALFVIVFFRVPDIGTSSIPAEKKQSKTPNIIYPVNSVAVDKRIDLKKFSFDIKDKKILLNDYDRKTNTDYFNQYKFKVNSKVYSASELSQGVDANDIDNKIEICSNGQCEPWK